MRLRDLFADHVEWAGAGTHQGRRRAGYFVNHRMVGYVEIIGDGGIAYYDGAYLGHFADWRVARDRVEGEHTARKHR